MLTPLRRQLLPAGAAFISIYVAINIYQDADMALLMFALPSIAARQSRCRTRSCRRRYHAGRLLTRLTTPYGRAMITRRAI